MEDQIQRPRTMKPKVLHYLGCRVQGIMEIRMDHRTAHDMELGFCRGYM